MSTHLKRVVGPHEIDLTQYWGGDEKGVCVQVTGFNCDTKHAVTYNMPSAGYVGLTKKEARAVGRALISWSRKVRPPKRSG